MLYQCSPVEGSAFYLIPPERAREQAEQAGEQASQLSPLTVSKL